MNKPVKLIDNQTIRIDNHRRGQELNWNDGTADIHIHKTTNYNGKVYEIRIPLNQYNVPDIKAIGNEADVPKKLKKEITKAFSDSKKVKDFFNSIYNELSNIGWNNAQDKKKDIISRIANFFGLNKQKLIQTVLANTENRVKTSVLQLYSLNQRHYQIALNYQRKCVYIGEFQLGLTVGIHDDAKREWISLVIDNLSYLLSESSFVEKKTILSTIASRIKGIGIKSVNKAIAEIMMYYYGEYNRLSEANTLTSNE